MSAFSKFLEEHSKSMTCQDLGLHSESCRQHLTNDIFPYLISNLKYFAPICILPAILKIRTLDKKKLRRTLEYYLGCSIGGTGLGCAINIMICVSRNIFRELGHYSFLLLPTMLVANVLYLAPSRVINLFETTTFQCTLEAFFLMRKNFVSRLIATSNSWQTFVFMTCSAIILHGKQMYSAHDFWLLNPNPKIQPLENIEQYPKCELHPHCSCKQYLFKGMTKYFIFGLSLDLVKMLMSQVKGSENQSKFMGKIKNFRIRSMALLTAYIGIYRFTHCWLNDIHYFSDIWNHILSSFIAGSCYYLYPQSTLFSFALIQATRVLWKIFEVSNYDTQNTNIKRILSIPYAKIMFPLALGYLVHLVAYPNYLSRLSVTVINGLTNNYPRHIEEQLKLLQAKFKK